MVFYHLINMALGSYIVMKPNYLSLFRIFFFIEINMYPLIWLYWISPKLSMLFHTDVCWGSSVYTAYVVILRWIEAFGTDRVQRPSGCCRREGSGLQSVRYCQVYHMLLYRDPFCFCFVLMTYHQSLLHRLGYLLMIASYIAPSALVQTVRLCKGSWILWND